jgi:hypothetical protein
MKCGETERKVHKKLLIPIPPSYHLFTQSSYMFTKSDASLFVSIGYWCTERAFSTFDVSECTVNVSLQCVTMRVHDPSQVPHHYSTAVLWLYR